MAEGELKTLGRYTIERTLGRGAMGVVYEGLDPKLNRRVAIKTILKSLLDPDTAKDYSMRFSREAQAVARLNHPHIVQVYDFAEEGDIAYLVMEFIRGKELKSFFDANERFDLKEAVRIMCELLDALEFAHNAGVIHRDIKPANVMLDAQARTKLTDFGVARVQDVDRTHAERTQAGTMVGTPAYMSPEQITGGAVDKRTDVFSAGIILYQFLTGEKPFTGGGAWTIAKKIIQEDPPLPSALNSAVTPDFDAVVNRALAKNPAARYQSAKDFAVALKRALEGRGEEVDAHRAVAGEIGIPSGVQPVPQPRPAAALGGTGTQTNTQTGNQEVELEFWRAIKDGNDPYDFELYVQQFPAGIYAALAKRRIAKLRGAAEEETTSVERGEAEEAARREAAALARLAREKEKLELEIRKKEKELKRREAEREEKARREVLEKAREETERKAREEAELKAREEAAAAAENARREAEEQAQKEIEALAKKEAAERAQRRKKSAAQIVEFALAVLAIAGAGYYFFVPDQTAQQQRIVEIQQHLEQAKRHAGEAEKAKKAAEEARIALEKARVAEEEAKQRGDRETMEKLAEERARAEQEARKTADVEKQREAEAKKSAEAAKAAQEKASAAERAAAEKAFVAKLAAEKAAAEKASADADAAERKIAEAKAAEAEKASIDAAPAGGEALFEEAVALERQGKGGEAVKIYVRAARAGSGKAAKRLGDIYNKGIAGVSRDSAESLKWYNAARVLGEEVPIAKSR